MKTKNATVATFTYVKTDGTKPKDRKILVMSKPSDSYLGVEFDQDIEVANLLDYLAERQVFEDYLKEKYGLADVKYKRFKQNKIVNLNESKLTI